VEKPIQQPNFFKKVGAIVWPALIYFLGGDTVDSKFSNKSTWDSTHQKILTAHEAI
jgi:hypothetical protein